MFGEIQMFHYIWVKLIFVMASQEMSVQAYADSIGVTRGTVYRHIYDKEAGRESKLDKKVKIKKVINRYVLVVPVSVKKVKA